MELYKWKKWEKMEKNILVAQNTKVNENDKNKNALLI